MLSPCVTLSACLFFGPGCLFNLGGRPFSDGGCRVQRPGITGQRIGRAYQWQLRYLGVQPGALHQPVHLAGEVDLDHPEQKQKKQKVLDFFFSKAKTSEQAKARPSLRVCRLSIFQLLLLSTAVSCALLVYPPPSPPSPFFYVPRSEA